MNVRFQNRALIFNLILALTVLPGTSAGWAAEVTPQYESELGQRVHLEIAASGLILEDPIANAYYGRITDRIMRAAGLSPGQYHFYLVKSDGINAFAVPGGYIYMHTETIANLENEGQLAAILAHETAHITSRHFARRVEASTNFSLMTLVAVLAGVAAGAVGGGSSGAALSQALIMGGTGATVQAMLAHSRSDETEADTKGRQYLVQAGYNARDMYGAFKIMSMKSYQLHAGVPTYLSTHPNLNYRLSSTFRDYENSPPPEPDPDYQAFRDRVLALSGEPRRVRVILEKRLQENPDDASARHASGLLEVREQNFSRADQFLQAALSLSPNNREYLADLGDLSLKRRRPEEARGYFERAGAGNQQAVLGLARACELLGQTQKAAGYYDQVTRLDQPAYPEALELAGRFFGNQGQRAKGHYLLARYFAGRGNVDQSIFHLEEALKAPGAEQIRTRASRELAALKELKEKTD